MKKGLYYLILFLSGDAKSIPKRPRLILSCAAFGLLILAEAWLGIMALGVGKTSLGIALLGTATAFLAVALWQLRKIRKA